MAKIDGKQTNYRKDNQEILLTTPRGGGSRIGFVGFVGYAPIHGGVHNNILRARPSTENGIIGYG